MKEKLTIALLKEAEDGSMGSNEVYTMTRSEAIKRMAKAICKQVNYQCSVCEVENNKEKCEEWIVFQYKTQAEAALSALLEDK